MSSHMPRYRVIRAYRSQYQQPIRFAKGVELTVGEEDSGPEGWRGWYWCSLPGQASGWVPQQVFEWLDASRQRARAIADYSACELGPVHPIFGECVAIKKLTGRGASRSQGAIPWQGGQRRRVVF